MNSLDSLKKIEVETEYRLITGEKVKKKRFFSAFYTYKIAEKGQIIWRINEPAGVFIISEINKPRNKFVLEEMPCDPIYWEVDNGRRKGPDEECKKKCKIYNRCPTLSPGFAIKDIINGSP